MGEEPDPDKMPLDASAFPTEVQVAFFVLGMLPDRWEGMSGTYMGKEWGSCEFFFKMYEVEEPTTVIYFMKMYEYVLIEYRAEKADKKQKADERKSASGGKNYTHNVRG